MAGTCGHRSAAPSPLQLFTDGITNKLVACYTDEDMADAVLVRVYGRKTELFVDRETELRNFQVLHAHGCAPDLYCAFQNGLCYEFLPGIALGPDHVRDPCIFRCVGPPVLGRMGSGREQGEVGSCFQFSSCSKLAPEVLQSYSPLAQIWVVMGSEFPVLCTQMGPSRQL